MLSRPNAPFYETALISAIEEKNSREAIRIIAAIVGFEGDHPPSLLYVDRNNMSFLRFAMHCGVPEVVSGLLATGQFDDNEDILFSKDDLGRTLVCQSVTLGSEKIFTQLCEIYNKFNARLPADRQSDHPSYKIWLKNDTHGRSLLHYASSKINIELYSHLIHLIRQESDADDLINQADHQGNTPLHAAIARKNHPLRNMLIDALLVAGAKPDRINRAGETPLDKLLKWDVDQQLVLLRNIKNKQPLLECYKRYIAHHPDMMLAYRHDFSDDDAGRAAARKAYPAIYVYLTYMSGLSLKERAIAELELNPMVEPRSTYSFFAKEDDDDLKKCKKSIDSKLIEDVELARKLPLYCEKLLAAKGIFAFSHRKVVQDELFLKKDTVVLDQLISDVNEALSACPALGPRPSLRCKVTAVMVPVLTLTAFAVTAACLISQTIKIGDQEPTTFSYRGEPLLPPNATEHPLNTHLECRKEGSSYLVYQHYNHDGKYGYASLQGRCWLDTSAAYNSYWWLSVGSVLAGIFATMTEGCFSPICWNKKESAPELATMVQGILPPLQEFSGQLNQRAAAGFASIQEYGQALSLELMRLAGESSKDEIAAALTRIASLLNNIRKEMLSKRKPLLLTKQSDAIVIDMEEAAGYESVPLLDDDRVSQSIKL